MLSGCSAKRRKEKNSKGLRHFSMKVCEKVQRKGVTSYNEVADELVAEFTDPRTMSPADVVSPHPHPSAPGCLICFKMLMS